MVAVGTIALFLVYVRGKHMAATTLRFRRVDAMIIYLFGTMSGQGNFKSSLSPKQHTKLLNVCYTYIRRRICLLDVY